MRKSNLKTTDLKGCCYEKPLTLDVETQTDTLHNCDTVDSSVQALVELDTVTTGTQTDDFQKLSNTVADFACQTDDSTEMVDVVDVQGRVCEDITDEKFKPLVLKCSGVFKDFAGK